MKSDNLCLRNCRYLDPEKGTLDICNLEVEPGEQGKTKVLGGRHDCHDYKDYIDCKGKIVMRSFVNSHHHIYSALSRGMPPPQESPRNFHEILKYIWWRLDRSLTKEMIRVSAELVALESLRNGVTRIIDHHSSPFAEDGSLSLIHGVLKKSGMDSVVCYELSDRNGPAATQAALEESERTLKMGIPALVGLHASFTVSDKLLENAVNLARRYDSGIHVHVAESPIDNRLSLENYGKTAVRRLKDAGALDLKKTLLAHCIHIDEEERDILRSSPAMIVRNPRSNLNNGVGIFDNHSLEDKVLIGTDGMDSDVISDVKFYFLLQGGKPGNSALKAFKGLRRGEEYLLKNFFPNSGDNNLVILDYRSPTELNADNFHSHFIYGMSGGDVETTISRGKVVMDNGKVKGLDEESILKQAEKLSRVLWNKMIKR